MYKKKFVSLGLPVRFQACKPWMGTQGLAPT